ncbi:hypothetical protein FB451DRAFT_1212407 [Mycena latifolia]|nr:hypothetical protein FB451DRAFT_1212407 [Mycena latifolia]
MSSTLELLAHSRSVGEPLPYVVFRLVAQTFFFGVYTLLVSLSTRMLLKRGLKTRVNRVMFLVILFMYLLSAAYWAYCIAYTVEIMQAYGDSRVTSFDTGHNTITEWSPVFNAVVSINYVLGDAVVAWRAWIISQRKLRKYLWIAIVFVVLTAMAVFTTIGFRITGFIQYSIENSQESSYLGRTVDILQMVTIACSLTSNIIATAVVGATAWRHRRIIRAALKDDRTRADKILALVVESGVFYCISGVVILVASLAQLPHGTLGSLYSPIHLEVAGAYPPIVILLVSTKRSLSESTFSDTDSSEFTPSEPIQIASARTSPTSTISAPELMDPSQGMSESLSMKKKRMLSSRFSDDSLV